MFDDLLFFVVFKIFFDDFFVDLMIFCGFFEFIFNVFLMIW